MNKGLIERLREAVEVSAFAQKHAKGMPVGYELALGSMTLREYDALVASAADALEAQAAEIARYSDANEALAAELLAEEAVVVERAAEIAALKVVIDDERRETRGMLGTLNSKIWAAIHTYREHEAVISSRQHKGEEPCNKCGNFGWHHCP